MNGAARGCQRLARVAGTARPSPSRRALHAASPRAACCRPPAWRRYATILDVNQGTNDPYGNSANTSYLARSAPTITLQMCGASYTGSSYG